MASSSRILDIAETSATDDLLCCSVCLDEFDNPRSLRCLHTFCASCLSEILELKHDKTVISCPMCTIPCALPNGINGLPRDFKVAQIKEVLNKKNIKSSHVGGRYCDGCKEKGNKAANFHCSHCLAFYCQECVVKHNASSMLRDHIVTSLETDTPNYEQYCQVHPSHFVSFVCHTCTPKCFLCTVCILDHDATHNMFNLEGSARQILIDKNELMKERRDEMHLHYIQIHKNYQQYKKMLGEVQQSIREQTHLQIQEIQAEELRLLQTAQDEYKHIVKKHNFRTAWKNLTNATHLCEEISTVLNGSDKDCFKAYGTLTKRIKEVKHCPRPQVVQMTHFEFVARDEVIPFQNALGQFVVSVGSDGGNLPRKNLGQGTKRTATGNVLAAAPVIKTEPHDENQPNIIRNQPGIIQHQPAVIQYHQPVFTTNLPTAGTLEPNAGNAAAYYGLFGL